MPKKQLIAALTAERTDDQSLWPVVTARWLLHTGSVILDCPQACAGQLVADRKQTDFFSLGVQLAVAGCRHR